MEKGKKELIKELEEKDKRLRELESFKSDFVTMISHELRTPLSIMKEALALLLDGVPGELNAKQKKVLSTVKGNIDRLTQLMIKLLDAS